MNRRTLLSCISSTLLASSLSASAYAEKRKPNIVLVLLDDLGWRDFGFMGNPDVLSPRLDKLSKESVVFDQAYVNAPNCAPSRASLLTGQYCPRHGVYTVGESTRGDTSRNKLLPVPNKQFLPRESKTLSETLKASGYATACLGMWNLGSNRNREQMPLANGFDLYLAPKDFGFEQRLDGGENRRSGGPALSYFATGNGRKRYRQPVVPGEYVTDRLTSEAISFVEKNAKQPFFLYLPLHAPHRPYEPMPELLEKHKKRLRSGSSVTPEYAATIERIDWNMGRLADALDRLQLTENTLFIFLSDNGGDTGARTGTNAPLRGGKGMLYEGGIRVPMFIRFPSAQQEGVRCKTPVIASDLYPTILDAAGISLPENHPLDGISLLPVLQGESPKKRETLFWHFPCYLGQQTPAGAIRHGDYKLIEFFEEGRFELYDLANDLGERRNLVDSKKEMTRDLKNRLDIWRKSVNAPVPTKLNPEYRANMTNRRGGRNNRLPR